MGGVESSVLAHLHPLQVSDLHLQLLKHSQRQAGSHNQTLRRPSRVAENARRYVPGDPVRLVDWRAFARTDQLLVRERREEASARVAIYLDTNDSMRWPDASVPQGSGVVQKMEIATRMALHLAYCHLRVGDTVVLLLCGLEGSQVSRFELKSASDVLTLFARGEAEGLGPELFGGGSSAFEPFADSSDMAYYIGDALSGESSLGFLANTAFPVLLHVLSSLETEIGWVSLGACYFDGGHGPRDKAHSKEYQGQFLRERYASALAAWLHKTQATVEAKGGRYFLASEQTPIAGYHEFLEALVQQR